MPTADPSNPDARKAKAGHFISAARVFTVLTFVSRIFGLVRDSVFYAVFGRTIVSDAFEIGFRVPNLFRRLFGEGALTSALIPVLTEYDASDDPEKRQAGLYLIHAVVTLTTMLLAAITIVIELGILLFWFDWSGRDPKTCLFAGLTALMLPYVILVCLVALGSAVLNVRGRFVEQASAPIILNVCNILTAAVIAPIFSSNPETQIFIMGGSVLVAGVLQLLLILRALAVRGILLKWRFDLTHPGVRRVMWLMAPMILPLAVIQINTLMDAVMAEYFTRAAGPDGSVHYLLGLTIPRVLENGAVAALSVASRIYEMPLGVFSVAFATAIFPALSRHAAANDKPGLADTLRRGLQMSLLIAIPATAGLCLLRTELVRAILQYGQFKAGDTEIVAGTMAVFAAGLAAFTMVQLLTRAFYALKQVRRPVQIAVLMVLLNLPLNVGFVLLLKSPAGLALSTTLCAFLQATWLGLLLRRQLGLMGGRRIVRSLTQTLIGTALMAGAIIAVQHFLGDWPIVPAARGPMKVMLHGTNVLIPTAIGVIVFYLANRFLKNEALHDLLSKEK